jgi:uncharacterized SAM-binding protein YcdF (DUF218 family)
VIWFAGTAWVPKTVTRYLETRYPPLENLPNVDVIVVLGGGTNPVDAPRSIVEVNGAADRLIYASWLYHQGVAPNLLVTGGYISWMDERSTTPAEEMNALLNMLGVPETAIWMEGKSQNTYENARYSKEILEEKEITQIVLVTSAWHMPRAVPLFENQGLEVIPAPTDFSITDDNWERLWRPTFLDIIRGIIPTASNLGGTTGVMKEIIGIVVYWTRGWL